MIIPLAMAESVSEFGGKATQLGVAERAGLPVPPGRALSVSFVERVVQGASGARAELFAHYAELAGPVAVRSSAVGEDSESSSFAGQHATRLNVIGEEALLEGVLHVYHSARTEAALAYRKRLGILSEPRMAIIMQRLVPADCSGVLFTRNPLTSADERVIEAAWGLGEIVVAGLVTPDRYRVARGGQLLERAIGEKDLAIVPRAGDGTEERSLSPEEAERPCLNDAQLCALDALASVCETTFGGTQDLEWSFAGDRLYLLQRRAITRA